MNRRPLRVDLLMDSIFLAQLDAKRQQKRTRARKRAVSARRVERRHDVFPDIVAWDGEGLTVADGTPQPYVYMANSKGDSWIDTDSLSTLSILAALTEAGAKYKASKHFIFGGSYDANQWLKDVPEGKTPTANSKGSGLRRLWSTGKLYWEGFLIMYRPRKSFYVREYKTGNSITIWDAFPWFQSSFVAAIRKYLGADYKDYDLIASMKAQRSQFRVEDLPQIEQYTQAELRALVELVRYMLQQLWNASIYPSRYDGPGAAAAYLLKQHDITAHKADTPAVIREPAAVAYSGGRIELMQYGTFRKRVYHYDVHSAYPAAMRELPSLAGGSWLHKLGDFRSRSTTTLYRVKWMPARSGKSRPRFYPFPFRTSDGSIYYPDSGESWIWGPELDAYFDNEHCFSLRVEILESYEFRAAPASPKPFDWVGVLFELRDKWKREGNGAEYGLKLGLNSLYGKLAQTVGWNEKHSPPYYQIEWAGLITSMTRAQLLRAACTNPDAVIMFATDGIFSTKPLALNMGDNLGDWGEETHDGISVVQSGVYFLHDGGATRAYTRGYSFERVRPLESDSERDARYAEIVARAWELGERRIPLRQSRFCTLGSALQGTRISKRWRAWATDDRYLDLRPTGKRIALPSRRNPARGLLRSAPASLVESYTGVISAPYTRAWREELQEQINGVRLDIYEDEIEDAGI